MDRALLACGALFGLAGVGAGAFGAHALRAKIPVERLVTFETGARYLLVHAFAVFAVVWIHEAGGGVGAAGWLFVAGSVVFSGSLFALALSGEKRWGAVTPIGGVLLLAGWTVLLVGVLSSKIA